MTWNTLTNLSTGQVVTETHMDNIRENIEHLGAMLFGANAASALTAGSQLLFVTGTYVGDGATTKTISGLGFTPRAVICYRKEDSNITFVFKTASDTTGAIYWNTTTSDNLGNIGYRDDYIISLGSGQFVVGDGTGGTANRHLNVNSGNYAYVAFR